MRILIGQDWSDGYLDETVIPGTCRLQVVRWVSLTPVDGLYFLRPFSLRYVASYIEEIGPRDAWRKIRSRWAERHRNTRWCSLGLGRVIETAEGQDVPIGSMVYFIAPAHPKAMERVVLPRGLIRIAVDQRWDDEESVVEWWEHRGLEFDVTRLKGWSLWSGEDLPSTAVDTAFEQAERLTRRPASGSRVRRIKSEVAEHSRKVASRDDALPSAVVFGYGNYVKTVLAPTIGKHLRIDVIHEVDPIQIPRRSTPLACESVTPGWDTSPYLRDSEHPNVVFIAGYHHTHSEIAVSSLRRGIDVVIEKPVATTAAQIAELRAAIETSSARCFAAYQRRYLPCKDELNRALSVGVEPIDYHCVVFEEPLPRLHWYRWPNSRSRLTSNGCHWVDHFLYLNLYSDVSRESIVMSSSGAISVTLELVNGAVFTMSLSDRGSGGRGLRDYVELRSGGVTARIVDSRRATVEGGRWRTIRYKFHRLEAHKRMYSSLSERVSCITLPGESAKEVLGAAEIVARLEEALMRQAAR